MWTYRVAALAQLGVPIRTGVERPSSASAPTGRIWWSSRPAPRRATPLSPSIRHVPVMHAWDVLRKPELIPHGSQRHRCRRRHGRHRDRRVHRQARSARRTILEGQSVVAKEMARNNRWDVLLRLRDADAQIVTDVPVVSIEGDTILCRSGQDIVRHPAGDVIVLAIGARPLRDVCAACRRGRRAVGHGG